MTYSPTFLTVDDISCVYTDGGAVLRRQVAKRMVELVMPWATIAFVFQDWTGGEWGQARISLQRWRHVAGRWRKQSGINLRPDMARAVALLFDEWGAMGDGLGNLSG